MKITSSWLILIPFLAANLLGAGKAGNLCHVFYSVVETDPPLVRASFLRQIASREGWWLSQIGKDSYETASKSEKNKIRLEVNSNPSGKSIKIELPEGNQIVFTPSGRTENAEDNFKQENYLANIRSEEGKLYRVLVATAIPNE